MKTLFTAAAILCLCSFSILKKKTFTPPGTVSVSPGYYADETEVSNFSWQEYEFWVKSKYGNLSPEHLAVIPDTNVWLHKLNYCAPYARYYYRHPAYKDYPVVGVSHKQALAFCEWRTQRVKEHYLKKFKKEVQAEYRLPTKKEWEDLAMASPNNYYANNGQNAKGEILLNCSRHQTDSACKEISYDNADVTAPVYSYWAVGAGLYNILGNVCEMTAEEGISKGGSWRHRFEECRPGKDIAYNQPEAWLGFRCVCVVK